MLLLKEAIIEKLQKGGPCCLDDVVTHLSRFNSEEVFSAIDRMSSDGRLSLRQLGYSTFQLSLGSQITDSRSTS